MEEWKDIPGYEGLYQASTCGRIRSCEGKTTSSARFKTRVWKQRIMKTTHTARKAGTNSDERVKLWKDGKEHTHLVSRLVALTWCDGYEPGLTVDHIDNDASNNHASNLCWIRLEDNIRKAFTRETTRAAKPTTLVTEDGEVIHFHSIAAACRYIGKTTLKYYKGTVIY